MSIIDEAPEYSEGDISFRPLAGMSIITHDGGYLVFRYIRFRPLAGMSIVILYQIMREPAVFRASITGL